MTGPTDKMLKMALEPPGATKLLVMASPYKPFGAQARIQDLFSSEPFVSFIRVRGPLVLVVGAVIISCHLLYKIITILRFKQVI